MKKPRQYVFFTVVLILAYLLNACSGLPAGAQQLSDDQNSSVTSAGSQLSAADDVNDNSVVENGNETNTNDENVNDDQDENSNSDDEINNGNENENVNDDDQGEDNDDQGENEDQEVIGIVEAITADSITIDGITYLISDLTEFNDVISVGDQVKIHVIVNADGTFTISEIEITDETSVDNGDDQGVSDNANEDDQGQDEQGGDDHGGDNSGDDGEHDGGNSGGDD